jgi:2-(1,2-epoxy-1,2-dihydrophenyl)acetyl-CoA isomerase
MGYQTIILEKGDGIATITLNRPQRRNAFNSQLLAEFIDAKKEVAVDSEVKVIIITGAGTSFCSGADFASDGMEPKDDLPPAMKMRSGIAAQETQMLDLRKIPKPVIAMVNGPAIGAGLGFCLSSDIIIAADDAVFGFGFIRLGLHPEEGVTFLLPRIVGMAKACELLFLGKTIDAREAEKIGLINQAVPKEKLLETTREIALSLAKGPSIAIGLTKISLYQSWAEGLSSALENEARANGICAVTEDQSEAVKAFREKRPPIFKGK